jgi:hypothetical protein
MRNYGKSDVVALKQSRSAKSRKLTKLNQSDYQKCIGELKGAGHLSINGIISFTKEPLTVSSGFVYDVRFMSHKNHEGEIPHLTGYLQSTAQSDKKYRVKGWINRDNTIRLEVVQ